MEADILFDACFKDIEGYISLFFLKRPQTAGEKPQTVSVQYATDQRSEASQKAKEMSKNGFDAYFSPAVLSQKLEGGQRGKKEFFRGSRVLWCDLDADNSRTKEKLRIEVQSHETIPPPSIMIDSGNGLHAYWILDTFIEGQDAIESRNYNLAEAFKADHCHSIDHLFRIPGTLNYKGEITRRAATTR